MCLSCSTRSTVVPFQTLLCSQHAKEKEERNTSHSVITRNGQCVTSSPCHFIHTSHSIHHLQSLTTTNLFTNQTIEDSIWTPKIFFSDFRITPSCTPLPSFTGHSVAGDECHPMVSTCMSLTCLSSWNQHSYAATYWVMYAYTTHYPTAQHPLLAAQSYLARTTINIAHVL